MSERATAPTLPAVADARRLATGARRCAAAVRRMLDGPDVPRAVRDEGARLCELADMLAEVVEGGTP